MNIINKGPGERGGPENRIEWVVLGRSTAEAHVRQCRTTPKKVNFNSKYMTQLSG